MPACNICDDDNLHCNYCKKEFIVELEFGVYASNVEGDHGRTVERGNAKRYGTRQSAEKAIIASRKYRPFRQAIIRKA